MPILVKLNEDHSAVSRFYYQQYPILVEFPPDLAHLAYHWLFHKKLQDALDTQRQATRRVHWKPHGWLRLTQRGNDGHWQLSKEG
jgi:hypothetical protein